VVSARPQDGNKHELQREQLASAVGAESRAETGAAATAAEAGAARTPPARHSGSVGGSGEGAAAAAEHGAGSGSSGLNPLKEIRRLRREKAALLQTGLYARTDPLIVHIEQQVQELTGGGSQQQGGAAN